MAEGDVSDTNSQPTQVGDLGELLNGVQPLRVDYRSIGSTGLRQFGGIVNESTLRGLEGRRAVEVFKEMGDNDPSLGIIEFMIRNIVRSCSWFVREGGQDDHDLEAADFVRTCMHDMDMPWDDYVDEILSFIRYGFSFHEIIYKRRAGRSEEGWLRSKYQDGRIGWRGFPLRAQDTVLRWEFDRAGGLTGMVQQDPTSSSTVLIPIKKGLLFRTRSYKNNPEGESAFRRAYRPYFFKKHIEETEAIGIQRDLAGMPVIWMPPEVMATNASKNNKALYQSFKDIVTKVRRDELEGVLMPLMYDENGNKMFEFQLLSSGGSRQFDTSKIIDRLKSEIFDTALAGMIMLGQGSNSSGSWAMHSDKTQTFLLSLKAYLSQIKNVINLHAIPRLLELNGMEVSDYPQIDHTPLENVDMKSLAESISALAMAGMPLFPNPDIERRLLEVLGMPVPADTDRQQRQRDNIPARTMDPDAQLEETHDDTPPPQAEVTDEQAGRNKARPIFRDPRIPMRQRVG